MLHEGLIGVLGDQGLQEYTYDAVEKEGPIPGQNTTRQGLGQASPAASSASPTSTGPRPWCRTRPSPTRARFTARQDRPAKVYQANCSGEARALQPGATAEATQRLFAGAKEVAVVDGYQEPSASRTSTC